MRDGGDREPVVLLASHLGGRSYAFSGFCGEVAAHCPEQVVAALDAVERAVETGLHAAGFVSYEAASGLDAALQTQAPGPLPLVWFGLFGRREAVASDRISADGAFSLSPWRAAVSRADFDVALAGIRNYIVAGDTYQVNYTFRMHADFEGDARALFQRLCRVQRTDYAAYLDLGRFQIASASPELFFSLKDGVLTARPMKGTAPRGRWPAEDDAFAAGLSRSEKDRAENVMIVDLLRNDLGRVSIPGSVSVPALWAVERYETVLQMTSTVTSRLQDGVGFRALMQALFPCGSITGAPKVRTMAIIAGAECGPRGIYTGSIGYVSPGGEACFNVAIRTVCIDRASDTASFGVGGGVTFDSSSDGEYEECRVKAGLLAAKRPDFDLFETLRFDAPGGFFLRDRHLDRLGGSARYFGFAFDREQALRVLADAIGDRPTGCFRVRLVLRRDGHMAATVAPMGRPTGACVLRVGVAREPVDSCDVLLFHKTTCREGYVLRLASRPDCDEVILVNEHGEVTECTIGNLVADLDGARVTPPVSCGLLAGTFRDALLAEGILSERVLCAADLRRADALYMINSVREWVRLAFID